MVHSMFNIWSLEYHFCFHLECVLTYCTMQYCKNVLDQVEHYIRGKTCPVDEFCTVKTFHVGISVPDRGLWIIYRCYCETIKAVFQAGKCFLTERALRVRLYRPHYCVLMSDSGAINCILLYLNITSSESPRLWSY